MEQATSQKQPSKAEEEIRPSDLYYFLMDDLHESEIAMAALSERHETKKMRVVSELPINELDGDTVIVAVYRPRRKRTAVVESVINEFGRARDVRRKPDELTHEVIETKPIRLSAFWKARKNKWGFESGVLDKDSAVNHIAQHLDSYNVKYSTDKGRNILTYRP